MDDLNNEQQDYVKGLDSLMLIFTIGAFICVMTARAYEHGVKDGKSSKSKKEK